MFIIRSPNPSHFSTAHHDHHGGHYPDPCDGARDAMMLLHHLQKHAMQDDDDGNKKNDAKTDQSPPKHKNENSKDKSATVEEESAKRTESSSSPSRRNRHHQQQERTFFQRVPVKQTKTKESATIAMDVAGFDTENIAIKLEDHALSVGGERKNRIGDRFVLRHQFTIDESVYDEDKIHASFSDGVLEITIERKPEPKAKMIPIYSSLLEKDDDVVKNNHDDDEGKDEKHDDDDDDDTDATSQDEEIVVESVPENEEEEEEEEEYDEGTKNDTSNIDGSA